MLFNCHHLARASNALNQTLLDEFVRSEVLGRLPEECVIIDSGNVFSLEAVDAQTIVVENVDFGGGDPDR